MLKVFLSSTFRDLKGERRQLLDSLNQALSDVGMENFIPDGRTSHEISIEELRKSDTAIFLISPYYGSLIKECKVQNCNAVCPMKNKGNSISYTHCEYKIALAENKLHQTYIVNKDWEIISKLKDLGSINWEATHDDPVLKNVPGEELRHFFEVADLVSQFRNEAGKEMAQYIMDTSRITSDLANNIVKWYGDNKIDLMDFCGRRATLGELIGKMEESVEIYGVGGIGKTSLVQLGLLIQKLKGKKIVAIGTRQSYLTGSGYRHFKEKCAEELYEVVGGKVTLEDVALALRIHENLLGKEEPDKINEILDNINRKNISLFIDDFHLSDDTLRDFINKANCSVILASKKKAGLARSEIPLLGIEEVDRYKLINLAAKRFHKELDSIARDKIKNIAEGHPVSTEILVRNFQIINFNELENFKKGLDISNPKHSEELLKREVKEILNEKPFLLLKKLSVINTEIESNINRDVIKVIIGNSFIPLLNELIDTGMLSKKSGKEETYIFSYKHIQYILMEDKKDLHRWALNYYSNKPLALGDGNADEIESLFHRSKIKPDEELVNDYTNLHKNTRPSQYGFKRLIEIGEQLKYTFSKNKPNKAFILGKIAISYKELNKFEESRRAYKEALTDYKELSRKYRLPFKPSLGTTLNNIANLYSDMKKFDESEKAYQEALKIRRELSDRDPIKFRPDLAATLNNIANLYSDLKKFDESEKAYQEALKIQRDIAEMDSEKFRPNLAKYLNNIAGLYYDLNKFDESGLAYQEALRIQKELADKKPNDFKPDLAMCLLNIAGLYSNLKKFDESERAYQEALKIERELAYKSPDAFRPNLADALVGIAILYKTQKRFGESEQFFQEALDILEEISDKNPDVFRCKLAAILSSIADLDYTLNNYDKSMKRYQEALEIRRDLADKSPDAFRDHLARTLIGIASLYKEQKKFEDSEKAYEEALEILRELADKYPAVFKDDLARILNYIASLCKDQKKFEDSEKAYQEALEIRRDLADKYPDVFKDDLAETLNGIASLYTTQKKFDDSEKAYEEALEIRRDLADKNPDVFKDDLAATLNGMAGLLKEKKKFDDSEKAYEEALEIRRDLAAKNPDVFEHDLAETLNGIASLREEQKKFSALENA